ILFGLRQNSGVSQCQSGATVNITGLNESVFLSKRPATSDVNSVTQKKVKPNEAAAGSNSSVSPSVKSSIDKPSQSCKATSTSSVKNGTPFPRACPKCNIHFYLMDPLKNHMKYCCPDMINNFFLGTAKTDCSTSPSKIVETETGKLIMLVNDFYYGKHEGDVQQVQQEQKTHTTFKCFSCQKVLKNNIRFMNHMKHHLELEKQNSESWESHTTCQHCYRQFPTPFQLQCHIESTHTPYESTTICKICELSFETEQILLQHMKDNHKPGEMPYVCQVCNYRSSAFSDVETHFRTVHENTKNLLCPFCLKVIKIGAPYMHHYMRHQKKGIYRCTKCRLQFLTCKEKMDHKTQHHRTFIKPKQLEGLPPGTKVTIRASLGSLQSGSSATSSFSTSTSTFQLSPKTKTTNTKNHSKSNASRSKPKPKPLNIQKKQSTWTKNKVANTVLHNLRFPGNHKCIECYTEIRGFASHFPAYVHCSLCRYSTSCSKSYVNHMMRGVTAVCLHCDFLTDVSGLDSMAKHLNESHTHTCQVIVENDSSVCPAAEHLSDNECNENQIDTPSLLDKNKESTFEADSSPALEGNITRSPSSERAECSTTDNDDQVEEEKQKRPVCDESELKPSVSSENALSNDETKEDTLDENKLSAMNAKDLKASDEDVIFDHFLRKRDEPESFSSDISEQGSIHLEPLTPSEVLEHEATEILQKGSVASSTRKAGLVSEQTDEVSKESSPSQVEISADQIEEIEAS
uniref:C2H2-type domain-containing protein n=1 Tax=Sphenodon punctatus TaxID=8508 RepID=A0A8D0HCZ1_SPHPU